METKRPVMKVSRQGLRTYLRQLHANRVHEVYSTFCIFNSQVALEKMAVTDIPYYMSNQVENVTTFRWHAHFQGDDNIYRAYKGKKFSPMVIDLTRLLDRLQEELSFPITLGVVNYFGEGESPSFEKISFIRM